MGQLIEKPSLIQAMGKPPKEIQEFVGRVNTKTTKVSIARMISPPGWEEPGQTPEFNEYTVVLKGALHVLSNGNETIVVLKNNTPIAEIRALPSAKCTLREFLDAWGKLPPDPDFADDLDAVNRPDSPPANPWD